MDKKHINISVVIPCYNVHKHILGVISLIGKEVNKIYVVDDCCPNQSGELVRKKCADPRVVVISHKINKGVGSAMKTGYLQALKDDADIIVKIDGDGQMNPNFLPTLIKPIILGRADYTKGNRFYNIEDVKNMPSLRIIGNLILSFMSKFSSGYWNIFDPTNGFTAIHSRALTLIQLKKINDRFFFESDMLFRMNIIRAVVEDVPMQANYGYEKSNLKISNVVFIFLLSHIRNFFKRIIYNYFLRDLSLASIQLLIGLIMLMLGFIFAAIKWHESIETGIVSSTGTVLVASLLVLIGIEFILSFVNYDIFSTPSKPLQIYYPETKSN